MEPLPEDSMLCGAPPTFVVGPAPRPPNRRKHEEQLSELAAAIRARDEQRSEIGERLREARECAAQLRDRRERAQGERAHLDQQLAGITKEADVKRDALVKLRHGLAFPNEEHLDAQIRALETELRKNHYKPTEEKKLVCEIDRLNRSRKNIKEHNMVKTELDQLRFRQREIRERRDQMYKERGDIKRREDAAKQEAKDLRETLEVVKSEIESLNVERRAAVAEFRTLEAAHRKHVAEKREEQRIKRREEKEAAEALKIKEWEEIKANAEPYEEERALCSTLIDYCLRFDTINATGDEMVTNTTNNEPTVDSEKVLPDNCVVYRKHNDDDMFQGVSKKISRKNAKKNAKAGKHLTHNPETFVQFGRLSLHPPQASKEVPEVVKKLKLKLEHYESLAGKEKQEKLDPPIQDKAEVEEESHHPLLEEEPQLKAIVEDKQPIPPPPPPLVKMDRLQSVKYSEVTKLEGKKKAAASSPSSFHPDQFPSLPKPAAANSGLFAPNAPQGGSASTPPVKHGWETKKAGGTRSQPTAGATMLPTFHTTPTPYSSNRAAGDMVILGMPTTTPQEQQLSKNAGTNETS